MPSSPRDAERDQERRDNNAAFYRVFHGEGTKEDARRVMEGIVHFCEMRNTLESTGLDGVIQAVKQKAKKEVYLSIVGAINAGKKGTEAEDVFGFEKSGVEE